MQGIALRWILGLVGIAGLILALGFLTMRNQNLALERDAAEKAAGQYADALEAYRTNFAEQVKALNEEKRAEIMRQENLLRTLNLIGDLPDEKNPVVPDSSLRVIDSLYGSPRPAAPADPSAGSP